MTTLKQVLKYARDCINDKIPSCQKHKWACQRFLKDYKATKRKKSKYFYDWERVEHVIKWAALFKHTKGILAGKPIELHISQVFIVANLYGFYKRDTGYRRFKKLYLQLARKNAKSQLLAVLATYELMVFLDGGMAEIYCAATKRDQAKIVYNEIKAILKGCDMLKGKWREAYSKIEHKKSDSVLTTLSKEDGKTGDGLNTQFACIDEYHAHKDSSIYDVIDSSAGSRPEPMIAIITTAGFDLNHPCYLVEYKMCSRILDPDDEINLEHVFCDVHELEINTTTEDIVLKDGKKVAPGELIDDPYHEENWKKANPIICTYPEGIDYLRDKAKEVEAAPDKQRNFYTKHLNIWVNQREAGYMPLQRWHNCAVEPDEMPDLNGAPCFVGLDLSAKLDLTSVGLVFPLPDDLYAVMGHSFMPENQFHAHLKTDKVPYDLWESQGWLTTTPGDVVDYSYCTDWAINRIESLGAVIQEWCVDPWSAVQLSNDLIEKGYTVVDIIQGIKTLSEPTKDFREQAYKKNVIHDGNPVVSWAIGNAVVDIRDQNMNILLSKSKSTERIDPIASIINAFVRARVADTLGGYNTRSMRSL